MKSKLLAVLLMTIFSFLFGPRAAEPGRIETKQEEASRLKKDRLVLKALRDAGSNLSKPHRLEHHFVTYHRAEADAVIADKAAAGYEVSEVQTLKDERGRDYWYFDLVRAVVPEERAIFAETLRMTTLEKDHDVLYDGWGCGVEK
jgi:regulator of ribonuclease activity B